MCIRDRIWVDLESPTPEEKRWIKQYYGLSIPEDVMDEDIEESARFYKEDNSELHIRSDFLVADDDEPHTVRVAFIPVSYTHLDVYKRQARFLQKLILVRDFPECL